MKARTKKIIFNVSAVALLLVLLIGPIRHIIANHPYEYVYFNELAGGPQNAFGNYELDYYYNSTREATEWVRQNAVPNPDGSKIKVATWHQASVSYFLRNDTNRFQTVSARWYEKDKVDWDYAIFTITGIYPKYLKSKYFPPKNTIKIIDVDGAPICLVLKRGDKNGMLAYQWLSEGKLDSAKALFYNCLKKDADDYWALRNLGEIYVRTNMPDSALMVLHHAQQIDPEGEVPRYLNAFALYEKARVDEALMMLGSVKKSNCKYASAYTLAIQIHLKMGDLMAAQKNFDKLIAYDLINDESIQLWMYFSAMQGIDEKTAYNNLCNKMIANFEKQGRVKEANRLRKQILD